MSFPVDDWQFWVVTLAALLSVLWLGRGLLPRRVRRRGGEQRATLTVSGKSVERRRPARGIRRRLMHWFIVLPVVIYAVWLLTLFVVQDTMMFPRHFTPTPVGDGPTDPRYEQWWIAAPNGDRVEAWFLPAPGDEGRRHPCVVMFHGNGEIIEQCTLYAEMYHRLGYSVLLPEYRGYGRSEGVPSQKAIVSDALAFMERLEERADVDAARIAYHGKSLGGGVAAAVAAERPPAAMILESSFVSAAAMAARYGAPGFVCRHPFRTDRVLESFDGPVLIMHGSADGLIPVSHAKRLAKIATDATLEIDPTGHNDFPGDWSWYRNTIDAFLSRTRE
ncbi:MAG: alpha/beta hydrolase [Planctomycetota bacterium]